MAKAAKPNAMINALIADVSENSITDFVRQQNRSFRPVNEDLTHLLSDNLSFCQLSKLGEIEYADTDRLLVFSCKIVETRHATSLHTRTSRKMQFEIAKKALKEDFKDGAIFVFYDAQGTFRFSFIRRNYGQKEQKYSNWKRFTYYVEPNAQTNRTFRERVGGCKFESLDAIQQAFSVEPLTKEFYKELFAWYQWALSDNEGFAVTFPNDTSTDTDDRKIEEHLIRLITRLMFVWFIKQKKLVPENIFKVESLKNILSEFEPLSTTKGNYYNAILQNLFFATLNKSIAEREFAKLGTFQEQKEHYGIKTLFRDAQEGSWFKNSKEDVIQLFNTVPFLNGGLFECLDKENANGKILYYDGFSRKAGRQSRAFLPNCLFFDPEKGLLPLLEKYNFTIEENTPADVEVALDPELLGKVFENLLGAYNPETKETARKQSGSFYTPREIVNYMVDESLIAYLNITCSDISENDIRTLFGTDFLPNEIQLTAATKARIIKALKTLKMLDPACGSGAFPMGMLNRMLDLLHKLAPNETSNYQTKLHLIENCIYGVDIQTIAVQISKLRFFISLICEQTPTTIAADNYGIITLPNLETKFVAANTLIGLTGKPAQGNLFEDPEVEITKTELREVRAQHFSATNAQEKRKCRQKDEKLREKLAKLLEQNSDCTHADALQLAAWNPYDQNASSPFFDPEWMFGVNEGFDVVIGNPPYVQLQKEGGKLADMYKNCKFDTFERTGDIYALFYEMGIKALKEKGNLCYITSNKWMRAGYGDSLRTFFAAHNPIKLIDLGADVFENATVDTNIIIVSNEKNKNNCVALDLTKEKNISDFEPFNGKWTPLQNLNADTWAILSPIENTIKQKIEKIGKPLKEWDINIYRGVLTGFNEAFIIDTATKERLCQEDSKSAEIIKPILRGKDIKKYQAEWAGLWLIFIPWHFPLHKDPTISGNSEKAEKEFEKQYNPIYKHLLQFKDKLSARNKAETGIRYEWYALQRCAATYYEDFEKEKIVWASVGETYYSYCEKETLLLDTNYFAVFPKNEINRYILGLLNSKIIIKWINEIDSPIGEVAYRHYKYNFEQIPIPEILEPAQVPFITLVDKILEGKKAGQDATALERQIDELVFKLYELTYEEVLVVCPDFWLSEEEYERIKIE